MKLHSPCNNPGSGKILGGQQLRSAVPLLLSSGSLCSSLLLLFHVYVHVVLAIYTLHNPSTMLWIMIQQTTLTSPFISFHLNHTDWCQGCMPLGSGRCGYTQWPEMCEHAKEEMKAMGTEELGSWKNAVSTADGCWLTRGPFSQNFTFIVKNYQNNSNLWYGHHCMPGSNNTVGEPLYSGTAKSAEGHLARKLFQQAKEGGYQVSKLAGQWLLISVGPSQECTHHYLSCIVQGMLGGHTSISWLISRQRRLSWRHTRITTVSSIPLILVTCCCAQSRHRVGCGHINADFICNACINHFLVCIQSGKDVCTCAWDVYTVYIHMCALRVM